MLELRPNCECCDRDLPPETRDAVICTFECTFCASCASDVLGGVCPNCGGELVRHPIRPADKLSRFPASTAARAQGGWLRAEGSRMTRFHRDTNQGNTP